MRECTQVCHKSSKSIALGAAYKEFGNIEHAARFITDRVRSTTREGYVLTPVCLSVHTWRGGTPARSRWGGGTPARSDRGEGTQPGPEVGCPPGRDGVPPNGQVRMGGYPRWDITPPPSMDGVPSPRYRTADGVLDMPRSVCLLRSRRRTVLFVLKSLIAVLKSSVSTTIHYIFVFLIGETQYDFFPACVQTAQFPKSPAHGFPAVQRFAWYYSIGTAHSCGWGNSCELERSLETVQAAGFVKRTATISPLFSLSWHGGNIELSLEVVGWFLNDGSIFCKIKVIKPLECSQIDVVEL